MSGLSLGAGAQVRVGAPSTGQSAYPLPSTASQAAFGPGFTQGGMPDAKSSLLPNDPFGVALWTGVAAVALLLFIRYSLPA